jgi:FkbH-like protein
MNPSYSEIQQIVNDPQVALLPSVKVAVLRNITVEPIEPYIKYFFYLMGWNATVCFGEYDTIFQDAMVPNENLIDGDTKYIFVFPYLETLSESLTRRFMTFGQQAVEDEVERICDFTQRVVQGLRNQSGAAILWMGFELPTQPALGILDSQSQMGQSGTIRSLNAKVQGILQGCLNSYWIDLNLSIARLGISSYFDRRYWHIGKAPFTKKALEDIASESFKVIRALEGRNKKCLVLDCDNTLWGGVIGEDGLNGIQLGRSGSPGSYFYEFQQGIVNLYHRGVILALCSKNHAEAVWDVFENHPEMVLKKEQVAAAQINWDDKATNMRRIAAELNIGLDSLVFMDDSEFEVNLVRRLVPEVLAVQLPVKKAIDYAELLAGGGWFDTIALTGEDRDRGGMYVAARQREETKSDFGSMEDYYRSLEMVIECCLVDDFALPRVAQLTQKTNQFNLTTKRYTEEDIAGYRDRADSDVMFLKVADRFGDYGIVGVCVLVYEDETAWIDTLLMSCRVLGRCVEDAFFVEILRLAGERSCETVAGRYVPTNKNGQVADFYGDRGLWLAADGEFRGCIADLMAKDFSRFVGRVRSCFSG